MRVLSEKTLYKSHKKAVGFWTVKAVAEDRIPAEGEAPAAAKLLISHAQQLGGAVIESEVPIKGKNLGKKNETSPSDQAVAEAASRVAKQLDKGYVETIEAAGEPVTNTLGKKKPMLAVDIDKVDPDVIDKAIEEGRAFLQPKVDGHRSLTDEFIYSRSGKAQNVAHVTQALHEANLIHLPLDGELYVHGMHLNQIGSLIKRPQPDSLKLVYYVYDLVTYDAFIDRYKALSNAVLAHPHGAIKLLPTIKVTSRQQMLDQVRAWEAEGWEGGILRISGEGYEDDTRSQQLIKVKNFTDMEVTVTGFELGTPKVVRGVELQQPILHYVTDDGKEGKVLAHGTAEEKHAIYEDLSKQTTIKKRLTIEHHKFTSKGVPNIATAKCWYEPL